jgi:hypothetical protein
MRLLRLVLFLVACVVGIGFYRGWFYFASDSSDHETGVTVTVDRDKVRVDEQKVEKSVRDFEHKSTDKSAGESSSPERP